LKNHQKWQKFGKKNEELAKANSIFSRPDISGRPNTEYLAEYSVEAKYSVS
jgi:hypothetical protein